MLPWKPMTQNTIDPVAQAALTKAGGPIDEVWSNDMYECQTRNLTPQGRDGMVHLSIKRWNRAPLRDWRHLQAIKNEVLGPEREAIEIYPAESHLVDQANQTHLWAFPTGVLITDALGFQDRFVTSQGESMDAVRAALPGADVSKGRQRDWQPGIPTGPGMEART